MWSSYLQIIPDHLLLVKSRPKAENILSAWVEIAGTHKYFLHKTRKCLTAIKWSNNWILTSLTEQDWDTSLFCVSTSQEGHRPFPAVAQFCSSLSPSSYTLVYHQYLHRLTHQNLLLWIFRQTNLCLFHLLIPSMISHLNLQLLENCLPPVLVVHLSLLYIT